MTTEEKAKAYEEALKRAEAAIDIAADKDLVKGVATTIFPELREREDERIKKAILSALRGGINTEKYLEKHGTNYGEVEAWLERQGTGNSHKENEDTCVCSNIEIEDSPNFEVGDWIVDKDGNLFYVYDKSGDMYFLEGNFGAPFAVPVDEQYKYHIWTFEDAKNGDVLSTANEIVLFNEKLDESSFYPYCHIKPADNESGWQFFDDTNDMGVWSSDYFKPAKNATRKMFYHVIEKNGFTTQRY